MASDIAIALHTSPHRAVSLGLLAQAVGAAKAAHHRRAERHSERHSECHKERHKERRSSRVTLRRSHPSSSEMVETTPPTEEKL